MMAVFESINDDGVTHRLAIPVRDLEKYKQITAYPFTEVERITINKLLPKIIGDNAIWTIIPRAA